MHPPELEGHEVEAVPGCRARKDYVCPACGNRIAAGHGHVVAWPAGSPDARRHWHRHCWRLEVRRQQGRR
ncbi:MAG: hypothetical protein ACRDUY_05010 [Nitriliruptorales bacterium]